MKPTKDGLNCTTSALNAAATWTGTAQLCRWSSIMITCATDQDGTITVEFSDDNTNFYTVGTFYYRTNRINPPHIYEVAARYYRLSFENTSASNQTYLRLYTYQGVFNKLTAPMDGSLAQNYDAIVTRPTEYQYEVAEGKRQGRALWNKFGYNLDVDTAATETVWAAGGVFQRMTSADTLDLVSDNATDDNGSTGANSVVIYGIDANWDEQIEVISLDGLTPVTTSNTWLGVNRVAIFLSGTNEANAGNITVSATTAATTQAYLPAGQSVTQQCIFFVPQNHQFMTNWLELNALKLAAGGTPRITFKLWVYSAVSNSNIEVFRYDMDTSVENHVDLTPKSPFPISEKTIVTIEATTTVNDTAVNGRFSGILTRDIDG